MPKAVLFLTLHNVVGSPLPNDVPNDTKGRVKLGELVEFHATNLLCSSLAVQAPNLVYDVFKNPKNEYAYLSLNNKMDLDGDAWMRFLDEKVAGGIIGVSVIQGSPENPPDQPNIFIPPENEGTPDQEKCGDAFKKWIQALELLPTSSAYLRLKWSETVVRPEAPRCSHR